MDEDIKKNNETTVFNNTTQSQSTNPMLRSGLRISCTTDGTVVLLIVR